MSNDVQISHDNLDELYRFNYVAKQANGSAWLKEGDSVILATVTADFAHNSGEDFVPLTVQYIEKSYAAGRIPGGFIKRESKPSDFETLTSRVIDRSIRPLFPKGFAHAVQVTVLVLSADKNTDLQRMALNATSAALLNSDLPIETSVCGARLTQIDGEFVVNPTMDQLHEGTLDLYLAGTKEDLLMIEMRSLGTTQEVSIELPLIDPMLDPSLALQTMTQQQDNVLVEEKLIEAIGLLQETIFAANKRYETEFKPFSKDVYPVVLAQDEIDPTLMEFVETNYKSAIEAALISLAKSERATIIGEVINAVADDNFCVEKEYPRLSIKRAVERVKRDAVRAQILEKKVRADGRTLTEVRPISIETNVLPNSHASTLFTRGQTQALAALTLGGSHDAQMYQRLTSPENEFETLMIHYNFPGFSVGEASRVGPAGRRELGHGNLAKRAIEPTFDNSDSQTVRIVSEILESNGSSSMATVCASSLAMRAASLNTTNLVAGVAMGMVAKDDEYAILTDIMGLEDHDGDMDFKVAGSVEGISAMQMDIKLGGISLEILTKALLQAKDARLHILDLMETSLGEMELNEGVLPTMEQFVIDPSKIADVIGQAGKTIRDLIERFDVMIDMDRNKGKVKISGTSKDNIASAKEEIRTITTAVKKEFQVGDEVDAKVKKLVDFGAFIELDAGNDGLLHISKISNERINHPSEVLSEGDMIRVRVSGFKGKKIELERV